MLSEVSARAPLRRAVKGTALVHRTGGRGVYFLLIWPALVMLFKFCFPQRREKALKSRGFLLPSPGEGCSIASAAARSSPWHLGTAVWQRSSWAFVTMQHPGGSASPLLCDMTLLGDTAEQQYSLQSPSAHFQSFLQTPAGPGCECRGRSGQQETAERKHP